MLDVGRWMFPVPDHGSKLSPRMKYPRSDIWTSSLPAVIPSEAKNLRFWT
jgi:hypothetical protein